MNNQLYSKRNSQIWETVFKSDFDLRKQGLTNLNRVYWNPPAELLYEEIILRHEGRISHMGAVVVSTGAHTARAAKDKYIVREASTEDKIWWGEHNQAFSADKFNQLFNRLQHYLEGRDLFVQDCYAGADLEYRLPVRVITEYAWHSLFTRNMFILPGSTDEYQQHVPEFTILCVPSFRAIPSSDGTKSGTFIIIDFERQLCIIGGTAYGGEIKKSIFTVLSYLLPLKGILPMHCSASEGKTGHVALFFGLSGTGKTTLSADMNHRLIGDDEHGWSERGVFNFEGGCYAKVIRLSPTAEPQIYACTQRFGTILENVIYDPITHSINLEDDAVTENTRASYPLTYIDNAISEKLSGHPENIVLLTCDASGVLPPIARLTPNQALYQFVSGYTAKIGGTELGLGEEPEITFSACFGAPFMVHHPSIHADLLRRKIEHHGVNCWFLNTGWVGGPFGIGRRIPIEYTRAMLSAALSGSILEAGYVTDPVFGFEVPISCSGIQRRVLDPASSWPSQEGYMDKYRQLAMRFIENFRKYAPHCSSEVVGAGPVI